MPAVKGVPKRNRNLQSESSVFDYSRKQFKSTHEEDTTRTLPKRRISIATSKIFQRTVSSPDLERHPSSSVASREPQYEARKKTCISLHNCKSGSRLNDSSEQIIEENKTEVPVTDKLINTLQSVKRYFVLSRRKSLKIERRRVAADMYRRKYTRRHTSPNLRDTMDHLTTGAAPNTVPKSAGVESLKNRFLFRTKGDDIISTEVQHKLATRRKSFQGLSREETITHLREKYFGKSN